MRCPASTVAPSTRASGLNPQRILVFGKSARDRHEPTRALRIGKGFFSGPPGIESTLTRQQPDLKDSKVASVSLYSEWRTPRPAGDHLHVFAQQSRPYHRNYLRVGARLRARTWTISMSRCPCIGKPLCGAISSSFQTTRFPSRACAGFALGFDGEVVVWL